MEEVADEYRGRVMSIFMMMIGMIPLGVLPAGLLAETVNGQFAVGLLAALLLIVTFTLWASQKQLRNYMQLSDIALAFHTHDFIDPSATICQVRNGLHTINNYNNSSNQ